MNSSVQKVFDNLTQRTEFVNRLDTYAKLIMDNKEIDLWDIPAFICIILEVYHELSDIKLTWEDLPILINEIIIHMIKKHNPSIPDDKINKIKPCIESSIRLVMITPIVSKNVNSCFSKIFPCCFSASAVDVVEPNEKSKAKSTLKKSESQVEIIPTTNQTV